MVQNVPDHLLKFTPKTIDYNDKLKAFVLHRVCWVVFDDFEHGLFGSYSFLPKKKKNFN